MRFFEIRVRGSHENSHCFDPCNGHLSPLLAIGRIVIAEGHEVVGLSGSALREH